MENYRMMSDNHITPLFDCLLQHLLGDIHRQQRLMHLIVGATNDKTCVIIRLLQRKWRKGLYRRSYLSDLHRLKQ